MELGQLGISGNLPLCVLTNSRSSDSTYVSAYPLPPLVMSEQIHSLAKKVRPTHDPRSNRNLGRWKYVFGYIIHATRRRICRYQLGD